MTSLESRVDAPGCQDLCPGHPVPDLPPSLFQQPDAVHAHAAINRLHMQLTPAKSPVNKRFGVVAASVNGDFGQNMDRELLLFTRPYQGTWKYPIRISHLTIIRQTMGEGFCKTGYLYWRSDRVGYSPLRKWQAFSNFFALRPGLCAKLLRFRDQVFATQFWPPPNGSQFASFGRDWLAGTRHRFPGSPPTNSENSLLCAAPVPKLPTFLYGVRVMQGSAASLHPAALPARVPPPEPPERPLPGFAQFQSVR